MEQQRSVDWQYYWDEYKVFPIVITCLAKPSLFVPLWTIVLLFELYKKRTTAAEGRVRSSEQHRSSGWQYYWDEYKVVPIVITCLTLPILFVPLWTIVLLLERSKKRTTAPDGKVLSAGEVAAQERTEKVGRITLKTILIGAYLVVATAIALFLAYASVRSGGDYGTDELVGLGVVLLLLIWATIGYKKRE